MQTRRGTVRVGETRRDDPLPTAIRSDDPRPTIGLEITEIPLGRLACRVCFERLVSSRGTQFNIVVQHRRLVMYINSDLAMRDGSLLHLKRAKPLGLGNAFEQLDNAFEQLDN
jgi:hypothetical protein